ncbi:virulence-associated E family protein [Sebaldella sp. S0638]|uniref:virulence-associated E family protein n=1 Tax=Sebaldella sp. S0638 TaxID=2957809 RepID=UPI0020A11D6F|nr:virulence-associated E family protein [Sebaldella sp. S0638]MCP1225696.1 virulence-associated E family protein [Sebaldella sp. S0638]
MENNRDIVISNGNSRKSIEWKTEVMKWSDFVNKIKTPVRTDETLEEFLAMKKPDQDGLKDVGGFVGGKLKEGKRRNTNILSRDLVTLDLDNIEAGKTEEVLKRISSLNIGYAVYSTRKHSDYQPRLRVIIPVDRSMTSDEYEPVARKLGNMIGIGLCDPTTFEVARLMFWPSCSSDSNYVYKYEDKPFIKTDWILSQYKDWKDVTEWPQVPGYDKVRENQVKKQQDPTEKDGVIGAFCKVFNIYEAIERFIPDSYEICDVKDRLTFMGGSTYGGAVVYDDKFVYSHHATDPAGQTLCNAFDLVRLHKFGGLDDVAKELTPNGKLPSFVEMRKLAYGIDEVAEILNKDRYKRAFDAFGVDDDVDLSWMNSLKKNQNGKNEKTIRNIEIILENDVLLKGKIALDDFATRSLVLGRLPWDNSEETEVKREWEDVDDSSLRNHLEEFYEITGKDKISDALSIVAKKNKINEVKKYLESLIWDGIKRLDTLLIDYFGAVDNDYTRQVMKVALTAAVARAIDGAVKYDYAPILQGGQGKGKTTFFRTLGGPWFSNSLDNFDGKEAAVTIQGAWIIELGELSGMGMSKVNAVKHFLSKQEDRYRDPFGHRNRNHPRRCVFFGTTNNWEFLRDKTGDRRFWPIVILEQKPTKSVFDDLPKEVDQIWAEAYVNFIAGLKLDLDGEEAKAIALEMQKQHSESSPKEGIISEFLETEIPESWNSKTLKQKIEYVRSPFDIEVKEKMVKRDRICALEIWCECLGGDVKNMKTADSREINLILENLSGWNRLKKTLRFGCYGVQRGFERAN